MPEVGLTADQRQVITEFQTTLKTHITGVVDRIDKVENDLRSIKQRSLVRTPAESAHETSAAPMLAADASFQSWLHSPRGKGSSFTTHFPFRLETKAVVPILGAGGTTQATAIAGPPQAALRLVELLPEVPLPSGSAVAYTRETAYSPGAAVVAEGTLKPGTNLTFENRLAAIQTIATICKASLQSLADAPGLQQWLDARLRHAVMLAAEDLFLNAPTDGLLALSGALDAAYAPGTGSTGLDLIGAAIGQLQAAGYSPDGVVVSGIDANKLRLLKASDGNYLWTTPNSSIGISSTWGIPTIISPAMPPDQWLVGAFSQSTILFVRQTLTVEIATENEDDFVKNLATLRAEERAALAIPTPAGLIKGTFTTTPLGARTPAAQTTPALKK